METSKSWIAVDLDGTLAEAPSGTYDPARIGKPVPPMLARVRKWLDEGKDVRIFTARASQPKAVAAIRTWLDRHGLQKITVITDRKDRFTAEIWDDRAVTVARDVGTVGGSPVTKRNRKDLSADTVALIGLAERIRQKLVNFAALPARDPQTGTFAGPGAAVTPDALRKAWRIPARIGPLAKIAPRRRTKPAPDEGK